MKAGFTNTTILPQRLTALHRPPVLAGIAASVPVGTIYPRLRADSIRFSSAAESTKPSAGVLLGEINEQPVSLKRMLDSYPDSFDALRLPTKGTAEISGIAEGSSKNALDVASPYIQRDSGLKIATYLPHDVHRKFQSAVEEKTDPKAEFKNSFFLTVSQSGKSSNLVEALEKVQTVYGFENQAFPLVPFTNNPKATLGERYGNDIDLNAGAENSIAATKSMTTSIMALLLFGLKTGLSRKHLSQATHDEKLKNLQAIPQKLETFLASPEVAPRLKAFAGELAGTGFLNKGLLAKLPEGITDWLKRLVQQLRGTRQFILLSRGPLVSILPEAALKLRETSRNSVDYNNTDSFEHGYKTTLEGVKGPPNTLYVVPTQPEDATNFFNDIRAHFSVKGENGFRTDRVYFIQMENSPEIPADLRKELKLKDSHVLRLPATQAFTREIENQFLGIIAFQLLSYNLALARGVNPNDATLSKAVMKKPGG